MTDSAFSNFPAQRLITHRPPAAGRRPVAASRPRARASGGLPQNRERLWAKVVRLTFSVGIAALLWIGWLGRDDNGLTPKSGLGYWLGVLGSVLMLLLLVYPLRKRIRSLRVIGTVPFWFRAHMTLGLFGCVLILWHANFRLGSLNSNVALVATLVVVASGIVGRYLYRKVHRGLYGRKSAVEEILADADALKGFIRDHLAMPDHTLSQLNAFARLAATAPKGIVAGLFFWPMLSWRGTFIRLRLLADARRAIALEGRRVGQPRRVQRRRFAAVEELVTLHVAAVQKAAVFGFHERLLSLWHFLHVPLFFLLVVATMLHVFAAHFF
jgi:hypothetical protein